MNTSLRIRKKYFMSGAVWALVIMSFVSLAFQDAFSAEKKDKKIKWVKSKTALSSLMTLSKDREAMLADYKQETKNYRSLKTAADQGLLTKGMRAEDVREKYGDAVVIIPDDEKEMTIWVYKNSAYSFFSGQKFYLFFNNIGELTSWGSAAQ